MTITAVGAMAALALTAGAVSWSSARVSRSEAQSEAGEIARTAEARQRARDAKEWVEEQGWWLSDDLLAALDDPDATADALEAIVVERGAVAAKIAVQQAVNRAVEAKDLTVEWRDDLPCEAEPRPGMATAGCFDERTPERIHLAWWLLDDAGSDPAGVTAAALDTAAHEIGHAEVYRTCKTIAPPVFGDRVEHATDAYAWMYLGMKLRVPEHEYDAYGIDSSRGDTLAATRIHEGVCEVAEWFRPSTR